MMVQAAKAIVGVKLRAILVALGAGGAILADGTLGGSTPIELSAAAAVIIIVGGWGIWLGRQFQRIQDRDKAVQEHLQRSQEEEKVWRQEVRDRFAALPCNPARCPQERR